MSIGTRTKAFEKGNKGTARPDGCTDEHLKYLDTLRETGITNMYGARPYLQNAFEDLTGDQAAAILGYWMKTFGESSR